MKAEDWLQARGGWRDDPQGRRDYAAYLSELALDEAAWEREGLVGLSRGWAIGTQGWIKALAKEYAELSPTAGLAREERIGLREASWAKSLDANLMRLDKTMSDLKTKPRKEDWKIALAHQIREETGASISWLATHLHLGGPATLRGYLHQSKRAKN